MSDNFAELFPELLEQARDLNQALTGVAMVVLFAALVIAAWKGSMSGDSTSAIHMLATIAVLAIVINLFPDWVDELVQVAHSLLGQLNADPSTSHQEFAQLLTGADEEGAEDIGFWDVLWSDEGGLGKAMIYVFVLLIGKLAWLIVWIAYLVQHVVAIFSIAVSPGFLAMFALGATRGVSIKFILSLLGVILWPIGWAVADIMTDALLQLAAEDRIYVITGNDAMLAGTQTLSFILLISIWMLVSTIAAPFLISKAIESGSQIGAAMVASLVSSTSQGASYGLGAGATARFAGASGVGSAAAAIGGGTAGLVSGAMGSGNALVPAAIGTMAVAASANKDINQQAQEIANKHRS